MKISELTGSMLANAFRSASQMLEVNKDHINALNVFPVPDGDTGTNMSMTLRSASEAIEDTSSVDQVMKASSRGALMGARGNSGVILSQILKGMYVGLEGCLTAGLADLNKSFKESKEYAYKAVMKPTEGTILTVVRAVADFSEENHMNYDDIIVYLQDLINYGKETLDKTPEMLKELEEAGVVDAGGKGYIVILEGLLNGLVSDDIEYEPNMDNFDYFADNAVHDVDKIKFTYCTEFMVNGPMDDVEAFRDNIASNGDSVIVVTDEDITKVHVHTNNPGRVLEEGLLYGYLSDIKIDNMKLESLKVNLNRNQPGDKKKYDFIVVSSGEGIKDILHSLGVDQVIEGGQTMNPSTEDLLKAVDKSNGEDIYLLPNNKNIIMSAEQVRELSDKKVHVIPTKHITEAFACLISFLPDASPEENISNMQAAMDGVKTIQITYAVRDSTNNGIEIKKDDYISLVDDEILMADNDLEKLALASLEESVSDDHYIITVYAGQMVADQESQNLLSKIEDKFPDLDIDLIMGGQPVYNYLISVE